MAFAAASLGALSVRGASHAVVRHTTWGEQKTAQLRTWLATRPARQPRLRQLACRATGGEPRDEAAPPAAPRPGPVVQEDPPWVRRERERELQAGAPKDLPFGVYLLFSTFVGIAAVGSLFEYSAKNPIFGVVGPDSPLYTPILGIFIVTGFPMCAYLFTKCVAAANAESERADKADGL